MDEPCQSLAARDEKKQSNEGDKENGGNKQNKRESKKNEWNELNEEHDEDRNVACGSTRSMGLVRSAEKKRRLKAH